MRRRDNVEWDSLTFRRIEYKDLPKVEQLHAVLFPVHYGRQFFERLITKDFFTIVAVTETDDIAGVVTAKIKHGKFGDLRSLFGCGQKEGYISTIGISDEYKKKGLGSYLLEEMCMLLEEADCVRVTLHVKTLNTAAVRFYAKNGFQTLKELHEYYDIDGKRYNAYYVGKKLKNKETRGLFPALWSYAKQACCCWTVPLALLSTFYLFGSKDSIPEV